MKLVDLDERLIAVDDDGTRCAIAGDDGSWRHGTPHLAAKAWTDGLRLTEAEAGREFPKADLKAVPAL